MTTQRLTIRYYMDSNGFGEIKAKLSINGLRFKGGATGLKIHRADFEKYLNTDGTAKDPKSRKSLTILDHIKVTDCLAFYSREMVNALDGKEIDADTFKAASYDACQALLVQVGIWMSNRLLNNAYNDIAKHCSLEGQKEWSYKVISLIMTPVLDAEQLERLDKVTHECLKAYPRKGGKA